jgi:hypothetical protein
VEQVCEHAAYVQKHGENLLPNIACVVNAKDTVLLKYDDPNLSIVLLYCIIQVYVVTYTPGARQPPQSKQSYTGRY